MIKSNLLYKLDNWRDKYDVDSGLKDLDNELAKYNLTTDNITSIIKYSYDDYGEISVLTKPMRDIKRIRFNKKSNDI